MKKKLNRLQWYTSITASILAFIAYLFTTYAFTKIGLLEMLCVFICFILPNQRQLECDECLSL